MPNITEEKWIEMLEKKADGTYIAKYPKVKSKSGVTFDEHLADEATLTKLGHVKISDIVIPERTITAGTGLTGGGNLASNITISADFGLGPNQISRGNHTHSEYLKASNGEYIGDGAVRFLNLGFTPTLVMIWTDDEGGYPGLAVVIGSGNKGALFIIDGETTKVRDYIKITTNGLQFRKTDTSGYYSYNRPNTLYKYIAFA